jgi:hypothetical protein
MSDRKKAADKGRTHYIGRPCLRGHSGLRYVSNGGCVSCVIASAAAHHKDIQRRRLVAVAEST